MLFQYAPNTSIKFRGGLMRHAIARKSISRMDRLDIAVKRLLEMHRLNRLYARLLEDAALPQLVDQTVRLIVAIGGVALNERLHLVEPHRPDPRTTPDHRQVRA